MNSGSKLASDREPPLPPSLRRMSSSVSGCRDPTCQARKKSCARHISNRKLQRIASARYYFHGALLVCIRSFVFRAQIQTTDGKNIATGKEVGKSNLLQMWFRNFTRTPTSVGADSSTKQCLLLHASIARTLRTLL